MKKEWQSLKKGYVLQNSDAKAGEASLRVYIGGGYVIEAASTTKGVIKTQVEGRGWQGWCKIPYIDYLEEE